MTSLHLPPKKKFAKIRVSVLDFPQLRKSNKFIENSNSAAVQKSTNVYRSERSISICVLVIYVSA